MTARLMFCLVLPLAICAAGDSGAKQTADKDDTKKNAAAEQKTAVASEPRPAGVPKDAVAIEPNVWKWTSPEGKVLHFRRTPFGVSRYDPEAVSAQAAGAAPLPHGMKAVDAGDEVRFERPTPFGTSRWTKKKTELDDVERRVWERDRTSASEEKK